MCRRSFRVRANDPKDRRERIDLVASTKDIYRWLMRLTIGSLQNTSTRSNNRNVWLLSCPAIFNVFLKHVSRYWHQFRCHEERSGGSMKSCRFVFSATTSELCFLHHCLALFEFLSLISPRQRCVVLLRFTSIVLNVRNFLEDQKRVCHKGWNSGNEDELCDIVKGVNIDVVWRIRYPTKSSILCLNLGMWAVLHQEGVS